MEETSETLPMYIFLQGAGLYIYSGDVTMNGCSIHGNSAYGVSACYLNPPGTFPHRPNGGNFPLILTYVCVCVLMA